MIVVIQATIYFSGISIFFILNLFRCTFHSLVIGIFAALLSGAAVAIAILGGNIGSLVGVAISASLLPPAVNSGVLWSLAVLCFMHADDDTRYNRLVSTNIYSNNHTLELVAYGVVSLMLTLINIICILIFGVLILKVTKSQHHLPPIQ